jgi:hypothetical protein
MQTQTSNIPVLTRRDFIVHSPATPYDKAQQLQALSAAEKAEPVPLPKLLPEQAETLGKLRASLAGLDTELVALESKRTQLQDALPGLMDAARELRDADLSTAEELVIRRTRLEQARNWLGVFPKKRKELLGAVEYARSELKSTFIALFPGSDRASNAWSPPLWMQFRVETQAVIAALVAAVDALLSLEVMPPEQHSPKPAAPNTTNVEELRRQVAEAEAAAQQLRTKPRATFADATRILELEDRAWSIRLELLRVSSLVAKQ